MGSCKYNPGINSVNPYAVLNVTQQSQNIAANQTVVRWELLIYRPSVIYSSAAKGYGITVNGVNVSGGTTTIGGSGTKTIASGTLTVPHNSDGTKSISFSFWLDFKISWGSGYIGTGSASGSMGLTTIPRATTPSLNPSTVMMGNNIAISLPRASGSFTHTLQHDFIVGSWTTFATGAGTSATLAVPLDWAGRIPNGISAGGRIRCITYNGGTWIGEKIVNFTAKIPDNIKPSVTGVTVTEATQGLAEKFAVFVQNNSKFAVSIKATGTYGSTIRTYSTSINGAIYSGNSFTSAVVTSSGKVDINVTVTDSRGMTATKKVTVDVLPYAFPVISHFGVERSDETGQDDEVGIYASADIDYTISPVNNLNDSSYIIEYKKESEEQWIIADIGSGYTESGEINLGAILDEDFSYNFKITVKDYFTSVVYYGATVPTAFTPIDVKANGKGVSFGEVANFDGFSVNMPARFKKDFYIYDGDNPVNLIEEFLRTKTGSFAMPFGTVTYAKSGKHVNLSIVGTMNKVQNIAAWTSGTIGSIPEELAFLRPAITVYERFSCDGNTTAVNGWSIGDMSTSRMIVVKPTGEIQIMTRIHAITNWTALSDGHRFTATLSYLAA